MKNCRICNNETELIMSFGDMPIANGFVEKIEDDKMVFELSIYFCRDCYMVQLGETVEPEVMFNSNYHFISSTSRGMISHFEKNALKILDIIKDADNPFVIELGCNDGIMLQHLAEKGIRHLGIEPSSNVADIARQKGINVSGEFFSDDFASRLVDEYGKADVICGSNVFCHIEDINSVFKGLEILLREDGIIYFEDPYLFDIVSLNSFDQIYDEHVYYFSGLSVAKLAERNNLCLVDMAHQEAHGGSMRYYLKKLNPDTTGTAEPEHLEKERQLLLDKYEGFTSFQKNIETVCRDFKKQLDAIKSKGGRIAGYGATSKSTTLLNYTGVNSETIDYISDNTAGKIGKYTPGSHIPVKSHEHFLKDNPPYTVLFAWNHKKEIFEKEKEYRENGGKFITYFPNVTIE